jgi:hypothetical protein
MIYGGGLVESEQTILRTGLPLMLVPGTILHKFTRTVGINYDVVGFYIFLLRKIVPGMNTCADSRVCQKILRYS